MSTSTEVQHKIKPRTMQVKQEESSQTTSNEEQPNLVADEGIQQIPASISASRTPAASEARDALLQAIAAEAQLVADKSAGHASTALEQLARAYALVAADPTTD
ncbi:hypothetical protein [Streptomyces lavendofoliae]|uniref:Uncharacterized protein n=1 Tax=Streptomyces lavendofoliae TaxID=67314 RepID=A0A918M7L0_9ACTN|nr:hypothetical protein [Streptomyces lavendofoliae]GGU67152.1 hypothetical protein GCM10010274_64570 [Streptomyces lavendofoliae]